jgi:hypothetical protein
MKNYKITIEPVEDLLQRSVDNIRYQAIKEKVNLESEIDYARKYIGSPMPNHANYLKELGVNYQRSKQIKYTLF